MLKSTLLFLIILLCSFSTEGNYDDLKELRLAEAKVKFAERDYREALKLLKANMRFGTFNMGTYLLLSDIYIKTGKYSKALRALYFIIKNGHHRDILEIATIKNVLEILGNAPRPSREILGIYYKIALLWFNLERQEYYGIIYQKSLLRQAKKYFIICNYYQYRIKDAKFYLALIERQDGKQNKALEHLVSVKELFKKESIYDSKRIKSVDFLIADTLVKKKNYDGGRIYMKSIYNDSGSSSAMSALANQYMDALEDNGLAADFTLGFKIDNNSAHLSSTQKSDSVYGDPTVYAHKAIDLYFSSKRFSSWSVLTKFNFKEDANTDMKYSIFDKRDFGGGFDIRYDNMEQGLFKFKYSYNKEYYRIIPNGVFNAFKTTHSFTPSYTHNMTGKDAFGSLSYEFPFVLKHGYLSKENGTGLGIAISYKPFFTTKNYAPVFAGSIKIINEEYQEQNYRFNTINFSFSNEFTLSDPTKVYLNMGYTIAGGIIEDSSYSELEASGVVGHELNLLRNLFLDASIKGIYSDKFNREKYYQFIVFSGLSYSF